MIYGAFPVCRIYTAAAHLSNAGDGKRHGCENALRHAGTCVGGHHAGRAAQAEMACVTDGIAELLGVLYDITRVDVFEGYKEDITLYCSRRAR